MKITKLGHCCLVIEERGIRIMTDPGAYSTLQNKAKDIDYIFITHEHPDHFHLESLKVVLKNNSRAKIITNRAVGKLLSEQKIPHKILEHGGAKEFGGVHVEGHGKKHALIYPGFGEVVNTGYIFANRFFYPGDAFYLPVPRTARQAGNPGKPVEILALPVAGPWLKIAEAIDYAKLLKPKVCFPVHDASLKSASFVHHITEKFLPPAGIEFVEILEGDTKEF